MQKDIRHKFENSHKAINSLKKAFNSVYPKKNIDQIIFAPGRVNLIGEHTDYNGGNALPIALSCGIYIAIAKSESEQIEVFSESFQERLSFQAKHLPFLKDKSWSKYQL